MDALLKAVSFAARKHHGQFRKDGATPYAAHPMRVLLVVLRELGGAPPEALAAAVLHDTVEDTLCDFDEIAADFGETVARYVALLTKDKRLPEKEREEAYFAGLAGAPVPVKLVKIADTLDNLRDSAHGNRKKTAAKAERLLALFAKEPALARALEVLRNEL